MLRYRVTVGAGSYLVISPAYLPLSPGNAVTQGVLSAFYPHCPGFSTLPSTFWPR